MSMCAIARPNAPEGVGCCEAPRGTLIHHYKIVKQGLMRWANLIIATCHNSMAMNRCILPSSQTFRARRVEAVIRAYEFMVSVLATSAWETATACWDSAKAALAAETWASAT